MTGHGVARVTKRLARLVLWGVGGLLGLVLLAIAASLVALNTEWGRRKAVVVANSALEGSFRGTVHIERIGFVGLDGVSNLDGTVRDAAGRVVIRIDDLDVDVGVLSLLWELVGDRDKVTEITLDRVHLAHVEVRIIDDGTGAPTLVSAFEPTAPAAPAGDTETHFRIADLGVDHAWIHGALDGTPVDAEVSGLQGSLGVLPSETRLRIPTARIQARALPEDLNAEGTVEVVATLPGEDSKTPLQVRARYAGLVKGVETDASVKLTGEAIEGTLVAGPVAPKTLSALIPSLQPTAPVTVSARIRGTLQQPRVDIELHQGDARVDLAATADLNERTVRVEIQVKNMDIASIVETAPQSSLGLKATTSVRYEEAGSAALEFEVHVLAGTVSGTPTPPLMTTGTLHLLADGTWRLAGDGSIEEPGASTELEFRVVTPAEGGGMTAHVSTSTILDTPPRLSKLVAGLRVRGEVNTETRYQMDSQMIESTADIDLQGVSTPFGSAKRIAAQARISGTASNPDISARATAHDVAAAGRNIERAILGADGTLRRLAIQARTTGEPQIAVDLVLALEPALRVLRPDITVKDEQHGSLEVSAEELSFEGGRFVARGLSLESPGGGTARITADYGQSLTRLELDARGFDVGRTMELLDLDVGGPVSGTLTGTARYGTEGEPRGGSVNARIEGLGYGPVEDAVLEIDADIDKGLVAGKLTAEWRGSKVVVEVTDMPFPEPVPPDAMLPSGEVSVHGTLELAGLTPIYELPGVPIEAGRGRAVFRAHLTNRGDNPVAISAALQTEKLELIGQRGDPNASADQSSLDNTPWSLVGVDLSAVVEADEGSRELHLSAAVSDEAGKLAITQVKATLPPTSRPLIAQVPSIVNQASVKGALWVLPRDVSKWPSLARVEGLDGRLSAVVRFDGTLKTPTVQMSGRIDDFGTYGEIRRRVDLAFHGKYKPQGGVLNVGAQVGQRSVASLRGTWRGDPVTYLTEGGALPETRVHVQLHRFPTSAVPQLALSRIQGHLSGTATLDGLGGLLQGKVMLQSHDLSVAETPLGQFRVSAKLDKGQLESSLAVQGEQVGRLHAEVKGVFRPDHPDTTRLRARVTADEFDLRTLQPFLAGTVNGLDGSLYADVSGTLSADAPNLRGRIAITGGEAQLPALGQLLRDIEARVELSPSGAELVSLEARAMTGKLTASGRARLEGLTPTSAHAELEIEEEEKVPLSLQGVMIGDVWGRTTVDFASTGADNPELRVNVEELHLALPEVTRAGVQNLEPAEAIEAGFARPGDGFVTIPLQPVRRGEDDEPGDPTLVSVALGSVTVHKGPDIEIRLGGHLRIHAGEETLLDGRIDVAGGELDVSGKQFIVESGTISFDRSVAEEGIVVARARWQSPTDYVVYAEYSGTLEKGQLALRSEPPLSEDEILSLLMFGTPDGSFGGSTGGSQAATAVGVAGGSVAKGLNRALANISDLDIHARVNTSSGEARPEVVVQLTRRITGRVTQAIGEPVPGQSPDRTFFTLDFRLFRRWSLSAQVGDEGGSSLDLIWRRRY